VKNIVAVEKQQLLLIMGVCL